MVRKVPLQIEDYSALRYCKYINLALAEFQSREQRDAIPTFVTEHCIIFLLKGSKIFFADGKEIAVHQNKVIMLRRGYYLLCQRKVTDEPYHSVAFYFNETVLRYFYNQHKTALGHLGLNTNYAVANMTGSFVAFKNSLLEYLAYTGKNAEPLVINRFEELLLKLLDSDPQNELLHFISSIYDTSRQQLETVVSANLLNPLSVDDLARLAGMSVSTFKREFKQHYQMPPKKWLLKKRLEHAKALLADSNKTVSEVGYACGFESTSHFIRVFRNQYGITPRESMNQIVNILD